LLTVKRKKLAVLLTSLSLISSAALANGVGENAAWQFQTSQDLANKAAVEHMIQLKKAGSYGPSNSNTTVNNTTSIAKQVNCSLSASSNANSGSNGAQASTSSPVLNTTSSVGSTASANGASSSGSGGTQQTNQSNSAGVGASVNGASTGSNTGPVSAGSGTTTQALNMNQANTAPVSSNIASSVACSGALN